MQPANMAPLKITTCRHSETKCWNRVTHIHASNAIISSVKNVRPYHAGRSKQMMNVRRYRLSGRTQRNGTDATSRHTLLVVAISSTEPQAGRSSHNALVKTPGGGASGVCTVGFGGLSRDRK